MEKRGMSVIVLIGLLCLVAGVAEAGTTLRLGHTDPPDGLRHKSAALFAEKVKEYTQGRYGVDVHHSSTLGDDPKLLEQVKLGAIDFAVTGVAIYSNQIPELGLLALPYLVESYDQGWALYDTSPWVKEWFAKLQTKNIRYLAMWEAGFRQLTAKRAVRVPEDVKGMKVRISKNQVYLWLWSALGANPTVMALGETYISLQQGVVDAQENPIPTIHVQKFYEVAKNISLTNHIYAPIPLSIEEKRWQSLSAADQAAVLKAAQEASVWHRKAVVSEDDKMLADMQAKGATVIKPDVPAFGRASKSVYDKAGEQFPKPVLEALLKDTAAIKEKYPVK
ncbi:MAG: siaP5 [candidate division NC10 bacterium]|nr:siaP5 [candidate division NC10 bacterium]